MFGLYAYSLMVSVYRIGWGGYPKVTTKTHKDLAVGMALEVVMLLITGWIIFK
jgi:hypothetical protein